MTRYAAFLKGMNLGRRRITNAELVRCFVDLGFADADAFQASGNVVFQSTGSAHALSLRIERGLSEALRYEVPTFVRSAASVRALAQADPFADRGGQGRSGKLQVALLTRAPVASAAKSVRAMENDRDWLRLDGAQLYWWPEAGVGGSELDHAALGKLLGPMTIRTQLTLQRLASRFFGG